MRFGLLTVLIVTGWMASLSPGGASRLQAQAPATPSVQETNDRFVREMMAHIAGHEDEPAEHVFKNIQILKGVRARTFLEIMDGGYSRALGVTCTHCHVDADFSSEDKRPKRAAREMAAMHRGINEQLHAMKELRTPEKSINCATCHRGAVDPRAQ